MATLSRLAYRFPPENYAPGPCLPLPDEFSALGFDHITYFHNGLIDGWAFIVEGKDLVVIAFRGTASMQNWGADFQVGLINPPGTDGNLRVHKGFYYAFENLNDGTQGLDKSVAQIIQATDGYKPIYLTGHSLGPVRAASSPGDTGEYAAFRGNDTDGKYASVFALSHEVH